MSKFQTKARAIELLGRKQIRDSITALAELMKNSYDADASWLRVEFRTSAPQSIVIADSGCGMSRNDIETKWFVLGTESKTSTKNKRSPDGRPLMGAKGIGRLASAKLGKQLWMFTKASDTNWNIIFINWDIFENPYIALEEVIIPSKYNIPVNELLITFDAIKKQMISDQLRNTSIIGWFESDESGNIARNENGNPLVKEEVKNLYEKTLLNINTSSLDLKNVRKFVSSLSNGTVLFIDTLNDDWENYLSLRSSGRRNADEIVQRYFGRFASFVSTFRHPEVNNIPFDLQIYIDDLKWEDDYSYTYEDYDIYDIKITGSVENGVFSGDLDALNADPELLSRCNDMLKGGLNVTSGIADWKDIDCGPYSITLCHIEGEPTSSGLSDDDYNRLRRKLDVACGMLVFRDGVRILPYGEPENDFLNIERRRSQNAGFYIFSHRNIFGRIDINSADNPLLEDKSSREGLLENNQYFYFVKTIENLLVEIAFNYLSKARKNSLRIRENFVNKNKAEAERKKQAAELEKAEKERAKAAIADTQNAVCRVKETVENLSKECAVFLEEAGQIQESIHPHSGYNTICKAIGILTEKHEKLVAMLGECKTMCEVVIPLRYAHYYSEELKIDALNANEFLVTETTSLQENICNVFEGTLNHLRSLLGTWREAAKTSVQQDPFEYQKILEDRLSLAIEFSRSHLTHLEQFVEGAVKEVGDDLKHVSNYIAEVVRYPATLKKSGQYSSIDKLISHISAHKTQIENMLEGQPEKLFERGTSILESIENEYQTIHKEIESLRLHSADTIGEMRKQAAIYATCEKEAVMRDEYVIGLLRQENVRLQAENDIYGDLANLGLAAEIVNHEFNQLFTNVNDSIKNLAPYVKDTSAVYWLSQIQIGFRAISDRQNQLSPIYRSYSLRKQEINLHDFIDKVCRFMENVFKRDEIIVENLVESDATLVVSPSKLFPVLSNILNNAAYWVLNQEKKLIRLRYDEEKRSLYIEDSGAGITALDKESIFEPFISYRPNGRGLGLTIVRKVLESQGYAISIDDSAKTLPGACFRIDFTDEGVNQA